MKNKILNKEYGIITYGITPPKCNNDEEKIAAIANRQIERISNLNIDALIIYDIQDESMRTNDQRPFDFISTVDSSVYANTHLKDINTSKIVYRCVGNYDEEGLSNWLSDTGDEMSVFVGAASKHQDVKISLSKAYDIYKSTNNNVLLGAVMIPERHLKLGDEPMRMARKVSAGCEYFISQCVYDVEAAKQFLLDYKTHFENNGMDIKPILFTLTPCGSEKTLKFIKWLGIHVPESVEAELLKSENMLKHSIEMMETIFKELYDFAKELSIPVGCNVESVSIRKDEILASLQLCNDLKEFVDKAH